MRLMNQNFCTQSATVVSASNINPNFPVSNMKHPFRSKRVRTALGTTTLAVVFDIITTEAIDSCVLLWPKEDGIRLSNTATVKIQANATNVWTAPAVDQTLTINNDYVLASHYFTADQSYRYWRVLITDVGNPYDYIELGVCWLGKSLDLDPAQNGFQYQLVDSSKVTTTDFGHDYVDEYPTRANLALSYEFLEYDEIQLIENAWRENGSRHPVMVVMDAEETVFDKDHFIIYGKFQPSFQLNHVNYNILNIEGINVREIA
jgi:hypothetical protein